MKFTWHYDLEKINFSQLSNLYRIAPLGVKSGNQLKIVFTNSTFMCFVYADKILVGAGRAIADGLDCSYICDVAVHPDYQSMGLGKKIMEKLMDFSSDHKKIILYVNPGKEGFYKKLGFKTMNTAMAIFKDHKSAIDKGIVSNE